MTECVKLLNNCLELFTLCKPKDSSSINNNDTTNRNTDNTQVEGEKLIPDMSSLFTLILPTRPKFGDEIRVKAKLKERPKQFILNLCVDSKLKDDSEPAMIAFHFRTHFTAHSDGKSAVFMSWKKGPHGWEETVEEQNTWIDDDVEEIDIGIKFTKNEIHFMSGDSIEYQFKHKYDLSYIDKLQISGDVEHVEEVALRYARK